MTDNIGIIQLFKILASAILAVFSCLLFILVIMFKLAEVVFQVIFNREKTQPKIIDIAN